MPPSFRLALAACVLCLGACQRAHDTDGATPAPPPAAEAPPAPGSAPGRAPPSGEAVAYSCEGDTTLVREADGSFRAEVPGNPPVRLARIAGSTPPVYTGASLYLRIGDGSAMLSQGDRANELRCTAD